MTRTGAGHGLRRGDIISRTALDTIIHVAVIFFKHSVFQDNCPIGGNNAGILCILVHFEGNIDFKLA